MIQWHGRSVAPQQDPLTPALSRREKGKKAASLNPARAGRAPGSGHLPGAGGVQQAGPILGQARLRPRQRGFRFI